MERVRDKRLDFGRSQNYKSGICGGGRKRKSLNLDSGVWLKMKEKMREGKRKQREII